MNPFVKSVNAIRHYLSAILLLFSSIASAQDVQVNLNMKHSVNGVSELDRDKFFIVHHAVDDSDWDSEVQRKRFLEDNDVYLGRSTGGITWHFGQTDEDPAKPGWPSIASIQSRGATERNAYAGDVTSHEFEGRSGPMVIGGQPLKMYPNGQLTRKGWAYADYEAVAEFYAHYFKEFYGSGGTGGAKKPRYLEVFNEPFVKAGQLGTTTENISQLHSVVARRVKELNPDVLVGGYGAAYPAYEVNNFRHWETRWKTFIDVAGDDMDYYSYHLYDGHRDQGSPQTQRKGSNIEAIMDMIEHYSVLKDGQRKPVYITEYGYFLREAVYYNKQSDWFQLRSYNSMLMQFMERQDVMIGAIPFMILKAEWGRNADGIPYGPRLMRQKKEVPGFVGNGEDWVYTDLVKYYQFWKDLKGVRAESRSDDADILTDAYVDGNKAYVLISNLSKEGRTLQLDVNEKGGLNLSRVSVSHLRGNAQNEAVWDQFNLTNRSQVQIGAEATLILTYEYNANINQSETSEETKYFADQYLQPISANTPIRVNINGVQKASIGEAVLRIGMGRDHGLSLTPTLLVNGASVPVPLNWKGDDQLTRGKFFGVLEIPVPYSLIRENNEINLTFTDNGGHVSSISMQHYSQTEEPYPSSSEQNIPNGQFFIVNRATGKKIRSVGENLSGNPLELVPESWSGNPTRWEAVTTGDGFFHLRNVATNMYFRPLDDGQVDGSTIVQRPTDFNGGYTRWQQVPTSDGYFYLQNKGTEMYFRPETEDTYSRLVQRPTSYSGAWTQWKFVPVGASTANARVADTRLKIYPNVVTQGETVRIERKDEENVTIEIINLQGELIRKTTSPTPGNVQLKTSGLRPGMYLLRMRTSNSVKVEKLVVD